MSDSMMQDVAMMDDDDSLITPKPASELAPRVSKSKGGNISPPSERGFIRSPLKPLNRSPTKRRPSPPGLKPGVKGNRPPSPRRLQVGRSSVSAQISLTRPGERPRSSLDSEEFGKNPLARSSSGIGSGPVSPVFPPRSLASPRIGPEGAGFMILGQRAKDFDQLIAKENDKMDYHDHGIDPATLRKPSIDLHSNLRIEIPRFSVGDSGMVESPTLPALQPGVWSGLASPTEMSGLARQSSFQKPFQPSSRAPSRSGMEFSSFAVPLVSPSGDGDFDLMSPISPSMGTSSAASNGSSGSRGEGVFNFLSPDPKAFDQRELTRKSDSLSQPKRKECPPTPERIQAVPLKRVSSLWEEKVLKSFWGDEPPSSMEFVDYHLIGEGAFFQVAKVKDKKTGKFYAVKKAKKRFKGKKDREEYLKEVEVLAALKPHENVVRYYQAWQDDGHFYLLMEYCAGNLNEMVNQVLAKPPGRLGEELLVRICRQTARGLNHIHASNILHLDIKPANILVTSNGVLKLGDFGHSILKKDWKDGHEGDATYMAPELLSSRLQMVSPVVPGVSSFPSPLISPQISPVSPTVFGPAPLASPVISGGSSSPVGVSTKADIFSLGLLLFELATGRDLPTTGALWQKLRQGSERAALFLKNKSLLSPSFQELIISMMNPNPNQRPSAARILELLDLRIPLRGAAAGAPSS